MSAKNMEQLEIERLKAVLERLADFPNGSEMDTFKDPRAHFSAVGEMSRIAREGLAKARQ